jgi:hypothetical protein
MNKDLRSKRCGLVLRLVALLVALLFSTSSRAQTNTADPTPDSGLAPVLRKGTTRDAVIFQNGDFLYGTLESISAAKEIRWRHGDVAEQIVFAPDHVLEVHFPPHPTKAAVSTNMCRLQLSNNDELEGDVRIFNEEKAVLQTWYAGEITLPRNVIQAVTPLPPPGAILFQGPTGLEGWTIGKVVSALGDAGEWKYKNGAFYATNAASIARKVSLPDAAVIEFDLAWKGLFQLAIAIYTDYLQPINLANKDTEPEFGGFYSLQLNSFSANLLPVKKNDPLRYLGQISVPAFNQRSTAHVEIRASKAKKTVALMVDGQVLKQWIDTEEFAGQGSGVRFVHQGQGKVRLSNFRVTEWDGQMEEKVVANPQSQQDVAKLRNGDKVSGVLKSIQDGKLSMTAGNASLDIPLNRVKQVELTGQKLDRPPRDPASVRAVFDRGGVVTFQIEKWEAGKVFASSPQFGRLVFQADAFSRLELQPRPTAK